MRVAILHNQPIHYKHLLFNALVSQGADIDVLFAARSSSARTASMQPIGESYRSHFLSDGTFEELPQIRAAVRAIKMAQECRTDVVVISGYSYLPTWAVLAWAKLRGVPVALWFESNECDHPRHWMKEAVKRAFVGLCDAGHVYGKSNREYLERLGMAPSAIVEKRATVDIATFGKRRAAFHEGYKRFVYVGRFSPEKNLPRLLEAFRMVRDECRAELVLVGYGPDEEMLRRKTRALGLDESVVFAGAKTQDGVSEALAESDCLVLPSLSEAWGLVANEALCTGVPVIVSDRCGCARDLATKDTGWVFGAEDTEALAGAMGQVCGLKVERLREMGEAAVKLADEYSPEECAKRILANLEVLVKAKAKASGEWLVASGE